MPLPSAAQALSNAAVTAETADAELVRSAIGGDLQAFSEVVHLHQGRVYNFLYHLTRNKHDAEDLTQQTFLKAYQNIHRFDAHRPLINWLLTIARNSALNLFRDTRRWRELPADAADSIPSPAAAAESRDQASNLWTRARAVLSAREFEVLWLRFAEDLSTEETARVAGLTNTHVKVLVHRARQALLKGES